MRCEESQEHLVALLHHELPPARRNEIEKHLTDCAACRDELENSRAVMHVLRRIVPVEPSGRARNELQQSLGRAVQNDPHDAGWKTMPDRLLEAPPQPPLLGFEQQRFLPPPRAPESSPRHKPPGKPGIPALSPSARSVHARIKARATKRDRPYVAWGVFTIGFAALLIVALAYRSLDSAPKAKPESAKAGRQSFVRWEQRLSAKLGNKSTDTFIKKYQVQLGHALSDNISLRVLPHNDPASGETCLVLYGDDDIARIKLNPDADAAAWDAMLARAQSARVSEGKCTLPAELIDHYIGVDNRAAILTLEDRVEIWSSECLERYLKTPPNFTQSRITGLPPINGLPLERATPRAD